MSSFTSRAEVDEEMQNWIKIATVFPLICKHLSEFVDKTVKELHQGLIKSLGVKVCERQCQPGNKKTCCGTCSKWRAALKKHSHVGRPFLANADPKQWPKDCWEVAKVYMNPGQKAGRLIQSVEELDISSMFTLILNCKAFGSKKQWKSLVKQVLDIRNKVFHQSSQQISDALFAQMQKTLITFLEVGYRNLAGIPEIEGIKERISKLKETNIYIAEGNWLEEDYSWKEMLEMVEEKLKEQEERLYDIEESLQGHGTTLEDYGTTLVDHRTTLHDHGTMLQTHGTTLHDYEVQQRDHGDRISKLEERFNEPVTQAGNEVVVPGNQKAFVTRTFVSSYKASQSDMKKQMQMGTARSVIVHDQETQHLPEPSRHNTAEHTHLSSDSNGIYGFSLHAQRDASPPVSGSKPYTSLRSTAFDESLPRKTGRPKQTQERRAKQSTISYQPHVSEDVVDGHKSSGPSLSPLSHNSIAPLCADGFEVSLKDTRHHLHVSTVPNEHPPSIPLFDIVSNRYCDLMPKFKKCILLIHSDDNELHTHTVHCFRDFLKWHCVCDPVVLLSEQDPHKPFSEWYEKEYQCADKIIILFSKESRKWPNIKPHNDAPMDLFWRALRLCQLDFDKDNLSKYLVAHFDYTPRSDVIPPMSISAVYKLTEMMEQMVFRIHDISPSGPGFNYKAPYLRDVLHYSEQGQKLLKAIQAMRSLVEKEQMDMEKFDTEFEQLSMAEGLEDTCMTRFFSQSDS